MERNGRSGLQLARLRVERHLTQAKLGELAGFRTDYISQLERGRYSISDSSLVRLAKALGLTTEKLERELQGSAKAGG